MSLTPTSGKAYTITGLLDEPITAARISTISSLVNEGSDGLVGWAVNIGAQGALETVSDWLPLPSESRLVLAKKRGHVLRSQAAKRGTEVHQLIQHVLHGTITQWERDRQPGYLSAFTNWMTDRQPIIHGCETSVAGTQDGDRFYAGTIDLPCTIQGRSTIVDWKTGKTMSDAYRAQLGGYSLCTWTVDDNDLPTPVDADHDHAMCVFLGDDGSYTEVEVDLEHGRALFLAAWNLYQIINYKKAEQQ